MPIRLSPLSVADLRALARGEMPEGLASRVLPGALAPPFVAVRSLRQLDEGKPESWCTTFHVVRITDDAIVGGCGFKDAPAGRRVEIGYGVSPTCRGQGFATAAVREQVRIAFASGEVDAVEARVSAGNAPSTRLVERLGFQREGTIVDTDGEVLVRWTLRHPPR